MDQPRNVFLRFFFSLMILSGIIFLLMEQRVDSHENEKKILTLKNEINELKQKKRLLQHKISIQKEILASRRIPEDSIPITSEDIILINVKSESSTISSEQQTVNKDLPGSIRATEILMSPFSKIFAKNY